LYSEASLIEKVHRFACGGDREFSQAHIANAKTGQKLIALYEEA